AGLYPTSIPQLHVVRVAKGIRDVGNRVEAIAEAVVVFTSVHRAHQKQAVLNEGVSSNVVVRKVRIADTAALQPAERRAGAERAEAGQTVERLRRNGQADDVVIARIEHELQVVFIHADDAERNR